MARGSERSTGKERYLVSAKFFCSFALPQIFMNIDV